MRIGLQGLLGCSVVLAAAAVLCGEQITSTCRITAVDVAQRKVTLLRKTTAGEREGVASVADDAVIKVNGEPTSLDKLAVPVEGVVVIYDTDRKAITTITAVTAEPSRSGNEPPRAVTPFDVQKAKEHQEAWAKHLGVPVETVNSIGMKFVLIPSGEFQMGTSENEIQEIVAAARRFGNDVSVSADEMRDKEPPRIVRIDRPIYIGTHEVTVEQFGRFVDATKFVTDAEKNAEGARGWDAAEKKVKRSPEFTWRKVGFPQQGSHPVVNVSWTDAVAFCRWLSAREGKIYRLPGELEWEYACRAGTTTTWTCGDRPEGLRGIANLRDLSFQSMDPKSTSSAEWSDGHAFTSPAGTFQPNAFGLCDMLGNVFEWCDNWQKGNENVNRVTKGGAFITPPIHLRAPRRMGSQPNDCHYNLGFRVVCECKAAK